MEGSSTGAWVRRCIELLREPRSKRDIVYLLLTMVPVGCTITYGALARIVGTSPRAVGAFMKNNECLVIVPCHRVVARSGIGGFSRGVETKKKLLRLEGWSSGGCKIGSVEEFWRLLERADSVIDVEDLWG
jgi:methylated-DNA-[protein]-cysteine S-methyltransferase